MRWLICALGLALALGGAASIVSGLPYIRMESGWTEVIAGTTALSAGIMTVALAAVLSALRRLELSLVQNDPSVSQDGAQIVRAEPVPLREVAPGPVGDGLHIAIQEPDVSIPSAVQRDRSPPPTSRSLAERIWSGPRKLGKAVKERADPTLPPEPYRSTDRSSGVRPAAPILPRDRDATRQDSAERGVGVPRSYAHSGLGSTARTDIDDRVPSLIPSPRPPDVADTGPSALPEDPTVVGRYESGGASYVLFSDGTIEVETEMGTHRFGSMEELKAYIDQQGQASLG